MKITNSSGYAVTEGDLRVALDTVMRESLRPFSLGLGVLYVIFAVSHVLVQPWPVAVPMALTASGTAVALFVLYVVLGQWVVPARWAHPIGAGMAGLVLLNSLLHMALLSDPQQTTNLMLLAIGVGCFFLSTPWLLHTLTATFGGWGFVVWGAAPSSSWVHFGFGLLSASVLSLLVHTVRIRTFRRLEKLRIQDERRKWELEEAIQTKQQSENALRRVRDELEMRVQERTSALAAANSTLEAEISERKRAEEALRRSEEHFRLLIENALDIIIILNGDGTVRYQSPSAERILGNTPEEVLGKSGFDFICPDDLPAVMNQFTELSKTPGVTPPIEVRVRHKDGSWRMLESLGNNLLDDPLILGIIINARDISERKRVEDALRESEERYRSLFENASDGIVTISLDGTITRTNRSLGMLLDRSQEELIGQLYCQFLTPVSVALVEEHVRQALNGGEPPTSFEVEVVRKDGSRVPVEGTMSVICDLGGNPVGIQGIARDISARRELEQQRTDFLAMLTHDIKNPLGAILGYTDLLFEEATKRGSTEDTEILEKMKSNTRTVHSLVANYLDLSRVESGHLTLVKKPLMLNEILCQVGEQYEGEARLRLITLEFQLQHDLPVVQGDPLALERVFANLLHNALKFTPEHGRVTISSAQRDTEVMAVVADTGPGIASEEIPLLFEKYQRAERTKYEAGTGLGLFIVKALAEAHGGRIEVSSTPGQGACFSVFLPAPSLSCRAAL